MLSSSDLDLPTTGFYRAVVKRPSPTEFSEEMLKAREDSDKITM